MEDTKELPENYLAWELFGAGFESVGKDGAPSELPLRPPAENELLLRVDALGICLSDIKIIKQGGQHPRLRGRDLASQPTVLGHECSATVVAVGDRWKDKFQPGQRYIVQADIYYKGEGFAFGYLIRGGMAQYTYIDERAIEGDEGCYLIPVRETTGHSQAALAEPWACVEMSYCLDDRRTPGGGSMLIITETPNVWRATYPEATAITPTEVDRFDSAEYDDIIIEKPSRDLVQSLAPRVAKNGCMFLVGTPQDHGPVTLDAGAIHYENKRYYGGGDSLEKIAEANSRMDLLPGGSALMIGAGGPMGQMHVQRAIEMNDGPALVVATDLDTGRLEHLQNRFGPMAKEKGVRFETVSPSSFESATSYDAHLRQLAPLGYSDIGIMVPVAALVPDSMRFARDSALINIFAGVPVGSDAEFELADLCRGIKLIGSSGSRIADMRTVLEKVERGELDTNRSVAAIGGLNAAREGLEAVRDAKYPGKTVLYTQINDIPLTPMDEVPQRFPELKDKLTPDGAWTKEAEQALMEKFGG